MQSILQNYGTSDLVNQSLSGEIKFDDAVNEAIKAWMSAVQQTRKRMAFPPMSDGISTEDFQAAFKAVPEKTTASPSDLHYSIWKVLAQEDDIASWLSTMMSLPFKVGFVIK